MLRENVQQLNAVVVGNVMIEYLEYEKQKTKNYRLKIQEFKTKAIPMTEQEKLEREKEYEERQSFARFHWNQGG